MAIRPRFFGLDASQFCFRIGLVPLPPVNHASGSVPRVLWPFTTDDALPTLGGSVAK